MTANPNPIDLPGLLEAHLQRAEPDLLTAPQHANSRGTGPMTALFFFYLEEGPACPERSRPDQAVRSMPSNPALADDRPKSVGHSGTWSTWSRRRVPASHTAKVYREVAAGVVSHHVPDR